MWHAHCARCTRNPRSPFFVHFHACPIPSYGGGCCQRRRSWFWWDRYVTSNASPRTHLHTHTGLLERPGFGLGARGSELSTESGYGAGDTNRAKSMGGGNHRVLLLDSETHTEKLVVQALTTVVNCDPDHALNCFHTSKQLGMAIVTTCMKEHAEFYAQQLWRRGCRASIEPDTSTI